MPRKTYIDRAHQRLERLSRNIEDFRSRRESREPSLRHETEAIARSFRRLSLATTNRLRSFAASGEGRWDDLQNNTETALQDMGSMVQRLAESFENGAGRSRYMIGSGSQGGWQLKKAKAARPTRRFGSKAEAVAYGRRYVRAKRPSDLLIRRRDGTFEATHRYD